MPRTEHNGTTATCSNHNPTNLSESKPTTRSVVWREGKILENLYATGAILEGFNPLKEGCGAGVSILSAMYIAEQILSK